MQSEIIAPYGVSQLPRSLAGLMSMYDHNYGLLMRLAPVLSPQQQRLEAGATLVSSVVDDVDLRLQITETTPYTSTLHLSYWFEEAGQSVPDPDLQLRLYYDALQVETLQCGRNYHCDILRQFRGPARTTLERKWQVNALLHKWLQHLLKKQHRFPAVV